MDETFKKTTIRELIRTVNEQKKKVEEVMVTAKEESKEKHAIIQSRHLSYILTTLIKLKTSIEKENEDF